MNLETARELLRTYDGDQPIRQLNQESAKALQRALAALRLLNPEGDVDGAPGDRTIGAWRLFQSHVRVGSPDKLTPEGAKELEKHTYAPEDLVGRATVRLPSEFNFKRSDRQNNKTASCDAIIAFCNAAGLLNSQTAYVLATAEHESDNFATLEEYSPGTQYDGRATLGNTQPGDGPRYKGRGYVQLTGRLNYQKYAALTGIKLIEFPVILMNWPALSVFVLVDGMKRGAYTGAKLDDHISGQKQDFVNARRIINGLDRADHIADLAQAWIPRL